MTAIHQGSRPTASASRERVERHVLCGPPLGPAPVVLREDVSITVEDVPRARDPARR